MGVDPFVALRNLALRYAHAIDRRDVETLLSVFRSDASLTVFEPCDEGVPRHRMRGHAEISGLRALSAYDKTLHVLGQSLYDVSEDTATGEVYCVAHHLSRTPVVSTDRVLYIRYGDRYCFTADHGWLIASRDVVIEWTETRMVDPIS